MAEQYYGTSYTERGTFSKDRYHPPYKISKHHYVIARINENIENKYQDFAPINSNQFKYLERIDTLNFYPKDMRETISLFLRYYGTGQLNILMGFTSPEINGITVHSSGLAMDILAENKEHARQIANAAYRAGIPNIAFGGDFSTSNGYVHIDIAPKEKFSYNAGFYDGPWS